MTIDERTIILDLMQKNRFELKNSDLSALCFQKTENDEIAEVNLTSDFPYYVENKYAHADLPDNWARQTLMLKSFEKVKAFAENDVNAAFDDLKQEFNGKLRR
jgi:NADPH-dependent 7-cyano-7-deazaguanine reductase QueF